MDPRKKGLLIITLATLAVSPEAAIIRFLSTGGVDPWTIIFWKLVVCTLCATAYALHATGGCAGLARSAAVGARFYALAIPLQMLTDIGFTTAFFDAPPAEVLTLIYLNPLWAGVLGVVFLGDRLPRRTAVALALALLSVALIFVPTMYDGAAEHARDSSPAMLRGIAIAAATGVLIACYVTTVRAALQHSDEISMTGAAAAGGLAAAVVAFCVREGDVCPGTEWTDVRPVWQFYAAVVTDGAGVGAIFVAVSVAPGLLTGSEIGLAMLIELVLGPFWVYLVFGDRPPAWTLAGGGLLLLTLILHEIIPLCQQKTTEEYSPLENLEEAAPTTAKGTREVVKSFA